MRRAIKRRAACMQAARSFLVFAFVMTVGILCRGHRFAFAYPNRIDCLAIAVYYLVVTALGASIAAIQFHNSTSV